MYDPTMVQPMRDEVVRMGVKEARQPQDVETALKLPGTTLVFVNSVCGCAAGSARPGLQLALMNAKRPQNLCTVFAGMDIDATKKAREHFKPYQPSSPQIALFKDGKLVKMWQRHDIEGRSAQAVAQSLREGFDQHC
jgi:putative YphP/YqiW family bacilliredoxin